MILLFLYATLKIVKFLIPLIIVVLLITSGYFFFQNQQLQKPKVENTVLTPTPVVKDETANWKTYINTNAGYSLKYPSLWSVKSFSNNITLNSDDKLHFIRVQQFIVPQNLTLDKFIYNDGLGENYGKAYLDGNKINLTFKNTSQHPIYNTFNPSNWGSAMGILIRFIQDQGSSNKYVWFSLEPYNPGGTPIPLEKEHEGIYYQILGTFRFLDEK